MTGEVVSAGLRASLRAAIAERNAAKEFARLASETADRAKQLVRAAETKLTAFGDVDGAILKHRAASFKSAAQGGPKPSLALPDDLLRKERARDEAAAAVSAARVAHENLVGELAEAQGVLRKAESKVSELAGEVLAAEAAECGAALNGIWTDLWATIDALNALRSAVQVKLPLGVVSTLQSFAAMDHRQFPGGRNEQFGKAVQRWRGYHGALCGSADATQAIDDGEKPPAAVKRVA